MPNWVSDLKQTPVFEWCLVGVKLRMDTKMTCVEKRLNYELNIC